MIFIIIHSNLYYCFNKGVIDIKLSLNNKNWTYYLIIFVYLVWILLLLGNKSYEDLVVFPYIIVPIATILHLSIITFKNKVYHVSHIAIIYFTLLFMRNLSNNFSYGSSLLINSGKLLIVFMSLLLVAMIISLIRTKGIKNFKTEDSFMFIFSIMYFFVVISMFVS